MRDAEREQIEGSTEAQLIDRLKALREKYDPKQDGGGYPMAQLRELHLIEEELRIRAPRRDEREERAAPDNHSATFRDTDIEHSLKYGR